MDPKSYVPWHKIPMIAKEHTILQNMCKLVSKEDIHIKKVFIIFANYNGSL